MSGEDKQAKSRNVFLDLAEELATMGAAQLVGRIVDPSNHDAFRKDIYSTNTARQYYLSQSIGDVQQFGIFLRSQRHLVEFGPDDPVRNLDIGLQSESAVFSMWQRRLLENLVQLVNYSICDNADYYFHHLKVCEYDHLRKDLAEQRDFFRTASKISLHREQELLAEIKRCQSRIDSSKCWYTSHASKPKLSSFKDRLKSALTLCDTREKRLLGFTYNTIFGESSQRIHYNVVDRNKTAQLLRLSQVRVWTCFLVFGILSRLHLMCDIQPESICSILNMPWMGRGKFDFSAPRAEIGDFILVEGPSLAEVIEVEDSRFGYRSYLIEFLCDPPIVGLQQDWVTNLQIAPYIPKSQADQQMKDLLRDASFTPDEIRSAMRKTVVDTWDKYGCRSGISEIAQSHCVQIRKE